MNFIKNNIKPIITFILGVVLASGIAVYASINANTVDYTNNKKVSDALNELYNKSSNYILPSGTQNITSNGTYDISSKASVNVNVNSNSTISKTLLWSNGNPSDDFVAQNVTLSQSLTNYSHILVRWKCQKTTIDTDTYDDIFKLTPTRDLSQINTGRFVIGTSYSSASGTYIRIMGLIDNTRISIGTAQRVGESITLDGRLIPMQIYGLNFTY